MINQSNIFKKIGNILNELQEQYQFLSENPEQLSELELELFLANANFLSDHVEIVRKLNNNRPLKELPQHTEERAVDIPQSQFEVPAAGNNDLLIEEIEREELHQDDLSPSFEFVIDQGSASEESDESNEPTELFFEEESPKEEPIVEVAEEQQLANSLFLDPADQRPTEELAPDPYLLPSEVTEPVERLEESRQDSPRPEFVQPSFQSELIPDKVEEKIVIPQPSAPVPDKIEEKVVLPVNSNPAREDYQSSPSQRPTLNDLLAGRNSQKQVEESAKPAITDLKRSITLNEKLLYIKDLFNGYNLAYSEAIDLINKMPDFKTADAFLKNNYAVKNNWEAKQTTVTQFYDLLKQRFPEG